MRCRFLVLDDIENSLYDETMNVRSRPAELVWIGDSLNVLREWPEGIRASFGQSLRLLQHGRPATIDVRPMQSIGQGVFELKDADESAWYRVIYLAKIEDRIYVLDCFTKSSRKTARNDLATAQTRLGQVQQKLREERKDAKRKTTQGQ
jgi:phage-related protein